MSGSFHCATHNCVAVAISPRLHIGLRLEQMTAVTCALADILKASFLLVSAPPNNLFKCVKDLLALEIRFGLIGHGR